jgi:uncharacterized membrane protein YeiH
VQFWIEHAAVAGSAVSGVLAATGKKVDLFGVIVLAVVTAFGGGTLRDLVLGELPVFWIRQPNFLYTAIGAALFTFFAARRFTFPDNILQIADASGLALFTILGSRKALLFLTSIGLPAAPVVTVTLGVVTGVAGGALRDALMREVPLVFRKQIYLYATAATAGALAYILLKQAGWNDPRASAVGITLILVLRLAAIRWKLSLPDFHRHGDSPQS